MPFALILPLLPAALTALAEGLRFLSTEQGQKVVADMLEDKAAAKQAFSDAAKRIDGWVALIGKADG